MTYKKYNSETGKISQTQQLANKTKTRYGGSSICDLDQQCRRMYASNIKKNHVCWT